MGRQLIVEVLGTGGAGKTTLEPLLAERLGVRLYAGGKRQSTAGRDLGPTRVWGRRVLSLVRQPGLFLASAKAVPSTVRNRLWFAMDLCRRQDNARIARDSGPGVLASGPLHALAQGSARFRTDLTGLVHRIDVADAYVMLVLPPETAARRLAERRDVPIDKVGDHVQWTERYERVVKQAVLLAGVPVVEVDAAQEPQTTADEAFRLLSEL